MKTRTFSLTKRVTAGLMTAVLCGTLPLTPQAQITIGLGGETTRTTRRTTA